MDANTLQYNEVITAGGRVRCISSQEIEAHNLAIDRVATSSERGSRASYWIGMGEQIGAAIAGAVMVTATGGLALAGLGAAVLLGSGTVTSMTGRISNRRQQAKLRELTQWESDNYGPWLSATQSLAQQITTYDIRRIYQAAILGSRVDPSMTEKIIGDWLVSVSCDQKNFSLEGLAAMMTLRHVSLGLDKDPAVMEALMEAMGEADIILANAAFTDSEYTLDNFIEWYAPKVVFSGQPLLSPVTKNLAKLACDAYADALSSGDLTFRLEILTYAYWLKGLQAYCRPVIQSPRVPSM